MRLIITTIFSLIILITFGQNKQVEELEKIYMSGDFDKTIIKANDFLKNDPNNIDYKLLLGRALTDKGDFNSAIPYLDFTVKNDPNSSWRKAWALGYLGTCYFMIQEYDNSKISIKECFDLNATKNATRYAYKRILMFGFDDFYKDWKIVESDNFKFYFQNMSDSDIEKYISSREIAFKTINDFFESELPKKIDFFVWDSRIDAKKLLKANLGFADPSFCIVHSHFQQTKGHEMTHVISNYSTKMVKKTKLINEGTAVCFDQTNQDKQDKEQIVKNWIKNNDKQIDISMIWENWKEYPEKFTYPLSGLFVKELIDNFGRVKFIEFFGNQTYENAKLVFGDELDKVIKNLENKINT
jgi:tetratricopeptide (TPR) repeat protein